MVVSEIKNDDYMFLINGRTLFLKKDMVDKYSDLVCPVDERYLESMIDIFGKNNPKDNVLSSAIEFDMTRELSGYER